MWLFSKVTCINRAKKRQIKIPKILIGLALK